MRKLSIHANVAVIGRSTFDQDHKVMIFRGMLHV